MLEQATDDFRKSVCKRVNTSKDQVQKDVENLKSWIRSQPHLPQCSTNTLLSCFLINCKNDMDLAKQKIDNYYTARVRMPDFFNNRDPLDERLQTLSKEICFFYLPKMTPDGHRVQILKFTTANADNFTFSVFLKRSLMVEDVLLNREAFNNGTFTIFDASNFSASHVLKLTTKGFKDILHCIQGVTPASVKKIVIINAPVFMGMVLKMMKPFMKNKLFERFALHSEDYTVLDRYLPRAMLPKDYGGEEETSEQLNENWMNCLEANREWLINEGSMKADETKRVKTKPLLENIETFSAKEIKSFKNLCID